MAHTLASRPSSAFSSPRCRDSFSSIDDDDDEDDINERDEARAADDEEGEAAMRWRTSRTARATRARQQGRDSPTPPRTERYQPTRPHQHTNTQHSSREPWMMRLSTTTRGRARDTRAPSHEQPSNNNDEKIEEERESLFFASLLRSLAASLSLSLSHRWLPRDPPPPPPPPRQLLHHHQQQRRSQNQDQCGCSSGESGLAQPTCCGSASRRSAPCRPSSLCPPKASRS